MLATLILSVGLLAVAYPFRGSLFMVQRGHDIFVETLRVEEQLRSREKTDVNPWKVALPPSPELRR